VTPQIVDEQGRWIIPRRPIPRRDGGIAKVVVREQREVRLPTAKADAILPAPLLQKKLGKSTFRLWAVLLTLRDEACETHPSVPGLVRATGLSVPQVGKSLARLRDFKLVEDIGFVYRRVPCRCAPDLGPHMHKVYLRKVLGVLKSTPDLQAQNALVPRETARMVKEAAGQGGARAGAGRPKGTKDSAPRQTIKGCPGKSKGSAYKYQEPISSEEPTVLPQKCGVSLRVVAGSTKGAGKERKNPLRHPLPILLGSTTPSVQEASVPTFTQPSASVTAPALPMQRSAPEAAPAAPGGSGLWVDGREVESLEALFSASEGATLGFGGSGQVPQQRFTPDEMRATTQLGAEIVHPRVPAPPKVNLASDEEAQLALLKAAYRAAHSKVLRRDFWRPARAQTAKEREVLLGGAQALAAEDISPAAWARFSFWQWLSMGKKTAPSAKWTWSAQRVHEHAGWCREAVGSLSSASAPLLPAGRELLKRLGALQQQFGWGRPTADVLSSILPDMERRVLVAKQAQQHEAWQQDIQKRIRMGEWVWG